AVTRHRLGENLRGIAFFTRQKLCLVLHDGDARAQTAEGLREFATKRTTADNRQAPGQLSESKDGLARYVAAPQPGKLRRSGNGASGHDGFVETYIQAACA